MDYINAEMEIQSFHLRVILRIIVPKRCQCVKIYRFLTGNVSLFMKKYANKEKNMEIDDNNVSRQEVKTSKKQIEERVEKVRFRYNLLGVKKHSLPFWQLV